jgi:MFS-type transporter involved in bile tolerance (Atg22 family)
MTFIGKRYFKSRVKFFGILSYISLILSFIFLIFALNESLTESKITTNLHIFLFAFLICLALYGICAVKSLQFLKPRLDYLSKIKENRIKLHKNELR